MKFFYLFSNFIDICIHSIKRNRIWTEAKARIKKSIDEIKAESKVRSNELELYVNLLVDDLYGHYQMLFPNALHNTWKICIVNVEV